MPSAVDHPPHYNSHPSGVEAVDVCEHLSFNLGNAVKYLWRAGLKGDSREDLEKALWYLKREGERFRAFVDSDDGCSLWDGEQWKPFARKVVHRDDGALRPFLKRLLLCDHTNVQSDLSALQSIVACELVGFEAKELG